MSANKLKFVVRTVGKNDATKLLSLPTAITKFSTAIDSLKLWADGTLAFSFEDNDWDNAQHLTPVTIVEKAKQRLKKADGPGIDCFVKGRKNLLKQSPIVRIRSAEKYVGATFDYSGEISPELRKLCDDIWAKFGADSDLHNLGVHVCRKIAGSTSWSQHSWDDAIDLGIGTDMQLGDDINHWLGANENKYGGFCERLWRVESHYDHIHLSLAPRHLGYPEAC